MKYLLIFIILFATSCSSHHEILGTTYGYDSDKYGLSIIRDIKVSDLEIREVKMKHSQCVSGYSHHIELNGPIGPDSSSIIQMILKNINKNNKCVDKNGKRVVTSVYMNSDGGLLIDGIKLGNIFRDAGTSTQIIGNQTCSSACAFAFVGGTYRKMDDNAKLMFHAPYNLGTYSGIQCSSKYQMQDLKTYFKRMLGSSTGNLLFDRTMSYCSRSNGWIINKDAANIYNILK